MKLLVLILGIGLILGAGGWILIENGGLILPEESAVTAWSSTQGVAENKQELWGKKYGEYAEMTIPYLKSQGYPGSEIEIEEELAGAEDYRSYVASFESEGLKIYGLLTKPVSAEPEGGYPAVVFLHGYIRPNEYKTTERYVDYVDYLASRGLVVWKIDLRGHGRSQGVASGAYFSSEYVVDTLNAVASLRKLEFVNSERVGLWGHSMSGNLVLRSMVVDESIKAGVIWAGAVYSYTDFVKYRIRDNSYVRNANVPNAYRRRRENMFERVGMINGENEFWKMVAPVNFLSDTMGAVQLHHAKNDTVVTIDYSVELANRLEEAGVEYEFISYDSGGHNLSPPAFSGAMEKTVEFYEKYL